MATEYISREAAIKEFCDDCMDREWCKSNGDSCSRIKNINAVPAADVVEVVRCLECKKAVLEYQGNGKAALWCPVNRNYRCRDEFCNRGERCDILWH